MTYSVAIQSKSDSGLIGDFLYEKETGKTISPVFDELIPLFKWIKENEFSLNSGSYDYYRMVKECKNDHN